MGLKVEREAAAMYSITSSKRRGGDALTTDSTLLETNADPFFQKWHIFRRIWFRSFLETNNANSLLSGFGKAFASV